VYTLKNYDSISIDALAKEYRSNCSKDGKKETLKTGDVVPSLVCTKGTAIHSITFAYHVLKSKTRPGTSGMGATTMGLLDAPGHLGDEALDQLLPVLLSSVEVRLRVVNVRVPGRVLAVRQAVETPRDCVCVRVCLCVWWGGGLVRMFRPPGTPPPPCWLKKFVRAVVRT